MCGERGCGLPGSASATPWSKKVEVFEVVVVAVDEALWPFRVAMSVVCLHGIDGIPLPGVQVFRSGGRSGALSLMKLWTIATYCVRLYVRGNQRRP